MEPKGRSKGCLLPGMKLLERKAVYSLTSSTGVSEDQLSLPKKMSTWSLKERIK